MHPEIGALIAVTIAVSLLAALSSHYGSSLAAYLVCFADAVLSGQVWRLVTATFVEMDPISLVFACLLLYWFGSDLARRWGTRRFLAVYVLGSAGAFAMTTLVALVWPTARVLPYAGSWPIIAALTMAWALYYPERVIQLYFVFPVSGRQLVWITVGGTALYAAYRGLTMFIPEFVAEGATLLYFYALLPRLVERRAVARRKPRPAHLRAVDDEPKPKLWN